MSGTASAILLPECPLRIDNAFDLSCEIFFGSSAVEIDVDVDGDDADDAAVEETEDIRESRADEVDGSMDKSSTSSTSLISIDRRERSELVADMWPNVVVGVVELRIVLNTGLLIITGGWVMATPKGGGTPSGGVGGGRSA